MVVFFSMLIGAMALIAIPTSLQSVGQGQSAAFKVFNVINRIPSIDAESEGIASQNLCCLVLTSCRGEKRRQNRRYH
jgi:hypothetical protein